MNKTISSNTIETLADRAIYKLAEEENIELGVALKNISEDKLKEITGRGKIKKTIRFPWIWPVASIAAAALLVVVSVFTLNQNSNNEVAQIKMDANFALDNAIVAYNYVPAFSKDGEEMADISAMNDKELMNYLPALQKAYENAPSDDVQECQDAGMRLAMAYLKLHEREKSITLLNELKTRFNFDEDYVAKCNKIINLLK